ncbi:MAG TPA: NADH-quinone oxidoreductase subunit L, partial [Usitatibacter sp.]|nr:NADH-quinone oxidoreductase subunit L [Usitatibacter sp.]
MTTIVLLPLLGFLLNGLLGRRLGDRFVSVVGCGLPIAAFVVALKYFFDLQATGGTPIVDVAYTWFAAGQERLEIAFYFDRLTAVMVLIVTGVGSLIHVYSVGYMKDDKSYARYFAYLNLFLFFMLMLVLGRSLLVLFVGWEGVGLASYLLIGFWFEDPAKAAAGKKAFITNRIGDAGFLLGMFLIYTALGTLDMDRINAAFMATPAPAVSASLVGILLFIGACGKSAQIPLHVWLPDAMAGPTPVSALIHAATMVTAGVYLVARLSGIYLHAPEASAVIAAVGVATAFFAATIAVVQTDIKKVLAYSTISQLGFMFVALGVGAYGAAIFHLYTHAFFKACLFLGAGSVIHALSGEQDVRKMGGLVRKIPVTFATFAVATGAIAGLPPLAGFFSKDEIVWFALASDRGGSGLLFAVAALTALLTSFYMFRLLWLTFLGRSRMTPEVERHVHESPLSMTGVLGVLAVLSAVGGFLSIPHFLEPLLPLPALAAGMERFHYPVVGASIAIAAGGLALAAWFFGSGAVRAERVRLAFPRLNRVLSGKYFVDEAYASLIAKPLMWISDRVFLRFGDQR